MTLADGKVVTQRDVCGDPTPGEPEAQQRCHHLFEWASTMLRVAIGCARSEVSRKTPQVRDSQGSCTVLGAGGGDAQPAHTHGKTPKDATHLALALCQVQVAVRAHRPHLREYPPVRAP